MNTNKLKLGQKVWIIGPSEYPEQFSIIEICKEENEVWLDNGNPYLPDEIWSSKQRCSEAN